MVRIESLHVYPVKGCRGIDLQTARVTAAGIEHDREWLITTAHNKFVTQREEPRLALITAGVAGGALTLEAPGVDPVAVPSSTAGESREVVVWRDRCPAIDQGDAAARWLSEFLGKPMRLMRFDASQMRIYADPGRAGAEGRALFADGYAMLVISRESLADLNSRLSQPLPMNRFRPNVVIDGVAAYGEDSLAELVADGVRLRLVKACTRCKVTTTNQQTGVVEGDEPLRTLKTYRWDREQRGVAFGQNAIVVSGAGNTLTVGQEFRAVPLAA
jgi:uncharacterized protein YcbX